MKDVQKIFDAVVNAGTTSEGYQLLRELLNEKKITEPKLAQMILDDFKDGTPTLKYDTAKLTKFLSICRIPLLRDHSILLQLTPYQVDTLPKPYFNMTSSFPMISHVLAGSPKRYKQKR